MAGASRCLLLEWCGLQIAALHCTWVILLNLVHTGDLQLLAIFHNIAASEHVFCLKLVKYQQTQLNNKGS